MLVLDLGLLKRWVVSCSDVVMLGSGVVVTAVLAGADCVACPGTSFPVGSQFRLEWPSFLAELDQL